MSLKNLIHAVLGAGAIIAAVGSAHADTVVPDVRITEWMYNPGGVTPTDGEFVEFTNLGSTAVDMTGWSEDDSGRIQGVHSLSGFGMINPGESVILTEIDVNAFRTQWNLSSSVKVVSAGGKDNLGRGDEINLYDATGDLVDRLTYDDQGKGTVKGPRTVATSGIPGSAAAVGANNASLWVLSSLGDAEGSYSSTDFDIGSPGKSSLAPPPAPVPLPATAWLLMGGLGVLAPAMRRRQRAATAA